MGNWKQHLTFGIILSTIVLYLTNKYMLLSLRSPYINQWKKISLLILVVTVYSLLPDIDHQSSKITWTTLLLASVTSVLGYIFGINYLLVAGLTFIFAVVMINFLTYHRGITHTLVSNCFFCIPLYFLGWIVVVGGFTAYFSHLILDKSVKLL